MKTMFSKLLLLLPAGLILLSSCSNDDTFTFAGTEIQIENVFLDTLSVNADSTTTSFLITMASEGIKRDTLPNTLKGEGSSVVLSLVSKFDKLKEGTYLIDNANTGEKFTGAGSVYFGYEVATGAAADDIFVSGTIELEDKIGKFWEIEINALTASGEIFESEWKGKFDTYEEEDEEEEEEDGEADDGTDTTGTDTTGTEG